MGDAAKTRSFRMIPRLACVQAFLKFELPNTLGLLTGVIGYVEPLPLC